MENKLNILLDISLRELITSLVSKKYTLAISQFEIREVGSDSKTYLMINCDKVTLESVCELGSKVFYKIFRLNGNIINDDIKKFVANVKNINKTNRLLYNINDLEFEINVNYDDSEFMVVDVYNREYLTKFNVLSITDNDGLDYANIQISNANLLDVFCLGFMICEDDIVKNEKTRKKLN